MEFFTDPKFAEEKEKRIKLMMPYQINAQLLQRQQRLRDARHADSQGIRNKRRSHRESEVGDL